MSNYETRISQMYLDVKAIVSKDEICNIVNESFIQFLEKNKSKTVDVKCINFQTYRQSLLSYVSTAYCFKSWDEKLNSLMDYIDNTFSFMFFRGYKNELPLHERVDNDFYFSLLTFCIDRIEFPSLVNDEIGESFNFNDRLKINLSRRNYLSTLMKVARDYFNQTFSMYSTAMGRAITGNEVDKYLKKNKMRFLGAVSVYSDKTTKKLNSSVKGGVLTLYRGYDISGSQNVILNRKYRVQESNKSYSFTLDSRVAEHFAKYKVALVDDAFSTSYQDRIHLVSDWMNESQLENYENSVGRKYIVSKYEISLDDVIFSPISTTLTEFEVIADPNKAKLTRYSIVYSS